MNIQGIIFDIGGVLEINAPTNWEDQWEQDLGFPPGFIQENLKETWKAGSYGWISLEEVQTQISQILDIHPSQTNEMMRDVWQEYLGVLNQEMYVYFQRLRSKYKTALLSNSFVGARAREQAQYRFEDHCDFIIYSHEVGLYKPDPRIYELTLDRLQLAPHETIFVDDVKANVSAAQELGIHSVLFLNTGQAIAQIEALLLDEG